MAQNATVLAISYKDLTLVVVNYATEECLRKLTVTSFNYLDVGSISVAPDASKVAYQLSCGWYPKLLDVQSGECLTLRNQELKSFQVVVGQGVYFNFGTPMRVQTKSCRADTVRADIGLAETGRADTGRVDAERADACIFIRWGMSATHPPTIGPSPPST